jgi:hypothetical protein
VISLFKDIVLCVALALLALAYSAQASSEYDPWTDVDHSDVLVIGHQANYTAASTDLYPGMHLTKEQAFPGNGFMTDKGEWITVFVAPATGPFVEHGFR